MRRKRGLGRSRFWGRAGQRDELGRSTPNDTESMETGDQDRFLPGTSRDLEASVTPSGSSRSTGERSRQKKTESVGGRSWTRIMTSGPTTKHNLAWRSEIARSISHDVAGCRRGVDRQRISAPRDRHLSAAEAEATFIAAGQRG